MLLGVKSRIIGTPLGDAAFQLRWLAGIPRRIKYPELWELYLEERRLPLVLQRLLQPDSNIIDIGAHIGSFTAMALRYAPDGWHIAIEPSKTRSAMLAHRFPHVEVLSIAIADLEGVLSFTRSCRGGRESGEPVGSPQRLYSW